MISQRILFVVLAVAALGVGLVACGGDDDDSTAATTEPAVGTSPAGEGAAAETVQVEAKDFAFTPSEFSASVGQTLTFEFKNSDSAPHTFTVYKDDGYTEAVDGGSVGSQTTKEGAITVTFDEAHDYYFRCEFHPTKMEGEIKVD